MRLLLNFIGLIAGMILMVVGYFIKDIYSLSLGGFVAIFNTLVIIHK